MRIAVVSSLILVAAAGAASAEDRCNIAMDQWLPREALQAKLEAEGWKVRQIKVEDGCYEAYAVDASGKRMETLFNPKTFEAVGADSDKG